MPLRSCDGPDGFAGRSLGVGGRQCFSRDTSGGIVRLVVIVLSFAGSVERRRQVAARPPGQGIVSGFFRHGSIQEEVAVAGGWGRRPGVSMSSFRSAKGDFSLTPAMLPAKHVNLNRATFWEGLHHRSPRTEPISDSRPIRVGTLSTADRRAGGTNWQLLATFWEGLQHRSPRTEPISDSGPIRVGTLPTADRRAGGTNWQLLATFWEGPHHRSPRPEPISDSGPIRVGTLASGTDHGVAARGPRTTRPAGSAS